MCKPEIQTTVTLVRGGSKVMCLLFSCHSIPYSISLLVLANIVPLREDKEEDIETAYREEGGIAFVVERFVVGTVNL